ncbi:MAG: PQQ-binding-like beta-propeller repeat protein [Prevotellaceae bacterium]|jgi:outer membrane protein assembly factor BamB|nr:PQQ-binding-like beta-propeller repeat protein [Prevotellaceae bacterium]
MNRTVLLLVLSLPFLSACKENRTVSNDKTLGNWSIFRGDPSLTACSNVSLPDDPSLLWTFKSDSYTKSSPVVYHQVTYWSDRRGRIFGIDINGVQVFDYKMETAVDAIPMIHDSTLYIGRIDGVVNAISLTKQDTLWTYETRGQIAASPNLISFDGRDVIIVGSYDNYLYCIDAKSGKEINRFESGYYINGAVAQNDNYVVFGGCDGWVRVVDCTLGQQTDSLDVGTYIPASPAISNNLCYIADHSGNLYEIELESGKITKYQKIIESQEDGGSFVSVPAVSDKMVYVVSDDRHLYAIDRKEGSTVWKYLLKGDTGESSPVVCRDKVLICTRTGIVSIHNAKTGHLLWEYDTGEQIFASPAVINGNFYILTFKGTLFCFGKVEKPK